MIDVPYEQGIFERGSSGNELIFTDLYALIRSISLIGVQIASIVESIKVFRHPKSSCGFVVEFVQR